MGQKCVKIRGAAVALVVSVCAAACSAKRGATTDGGTTRVEVHTPSPDGLPDADVPSDEVMPNTNAGTPNFSTPNSDGGAANTADAPSAPDASDVPVAPVPGSLEVSWMHGFANCAESTDAELQLHEYNATTIIIRQDKCRTFEAPFVYLLIGADTALLLDSGATNSTALRDTVVPLLGARALLVAHTHAHGDHAASDSRFLGQPATTVIGTGVTAVQAAFGIDPWPAAVSQLDLGGRVLDVLAIPGHEQSHIALYDRQTGLLFTGDTLYPGLLFINDWATYRASVRRLAEFVAMHPVSHVLGAHIEMTATSGLNYAYGTTFQPNEHVLQLDAAHVLELDAALTLLGPTPPAQPVAHDDFVIQPQ